MNGHFTRSSGEYVCSLCGCTIPEDTAYFIQECTSSADDFRMCDWCIDEVAKRLMRFKMVTS